MKSGFILHFGILFLTAVSISGCSEKSPGDDPEDFFSMKKIINSPLTELVLDDFTMKSDDGFLLSGYIDPSYYFTEYRSAVISLKPNGETQWTSVFDVDSFTYSAATSAIELSDGYTLVAGICGYTFTDQSRFIATLGINHDVLNHAFLPIPPGYQAWFSRLIPRSDGNIYLVSSYTPPEWNGSYALEIDLLDASGNLIWNKVFNDVHANTDQINLSSDDGLIISGTLEHGIIDGSPDFLFLQTDRDGNEMIHSTFGSPVNWEYGNFGIEEKGNGFVFSGTTSPSAACTIYRINSSGEVTGPVFIEKYKNYTSQNYILQTRAPGYMVMSYTDSYFVFFRLNEDLSVKWSTSLIIRSAGMGYGSVSSCHFVPASNGQFAFAYQSVDKIVLVKIRTY